MELSKATFKGWSTEERRSSKRSGQRSIKLPRLSSILWWGKKERRNAAPEMEATDERDPRHNRAGLPWWSEVNNRNRGEGRELKDSRRKVTKGGQVLALKSSQGMTSRRLEARAGSASKARLVTRRDDADRALTTAQGDERKRHTERRLRVWGMLDLYPDFLSRLNLKFALPPTFYWEVVILFDEMFERSGC